MLLVVNPNMALDRVVVTGFRQGATLRPHRFSLWAGGSGTHAAYVARLLGAEVCVTGFVGGHTGALLRELLAAQGVPCDLTEIGGETRQTLSLLDDEQGNICDIAEYGPSVTAQDVERLEAAVTRHLRDARMMIVSGSIPAGCPPDLPARLIATARDMGIPCVADLAGQTVLMAALSAGPWLIKPSRTEIGEFLGIEAPSLSDLVAVGHEWLDRGAENVCISLDVAGLLWISPSGATRFTSPDVQAFNSIGCGDTLVGALAASYLAHRDLDLALRRGVAAAAANLRYDAPGYCTPQEVSELLNRVGTESVDS